MVSGDLKLDELILQVFEEHEETFFWPLESQKEAKSFIKFIHEKGFLYEDMGKEIGELEDNFRAWRKGLGRVGIGSRMIQRINKTVESVIESDDEDDTEHNRRMLAKVNEKSQTKAKEKPKEEPKDPKQKQQDLASSMMKNIDKVSSQMNGTSHQKEETPLSAKPPVHEHPAKSHETKTETPVPATKTEPVKSEPPKSQEPKQTPVVKKEEKVTPKPEPAKLPEVQTAGSSSTKEKHATDRPRVQELRAERKDEKIETKYHHDEDDDDDDKDEDPEVDEVKRKMEAIRKKVEMMKRAKAEAAAAAAAAAENNADQSSNAQGGEAGEKYEAMKKRLGELRSKLMEDETQTISSEPNLADNRENLVKQESEAQSHQKPASAPEAPPPAMVAPIAAVDDEDDVSDASTESSDLEDDDMYDDDDKQTYNSDLDPESYDSDLDYELYQEVTTLTKNIESTLTKMKKYRDGPGHLYVFSDSAASEREHRVKIGCTRSPDKKFQEARKYNVALKRVSSVPVNKRHSALKSVLRAMHKYRIGSDTDWFKGPIDTILQRISAVTEKYGTGPALVTFDSKC